MPGLIIPFDPAGLDPKTAHVLDDIVTALQTWINIGSQTVAGNLVVNGMLTVNGQPRARVFKSSQTITTATDTMVLWNAVTPGSSAEEYDTHSPVMLDPSSGKVFFREAGLYHVAAQVQWDGSALGTSRVCRIYLNNSNAGSANAIASDRRAPDATNGPPHYISVIVPITQADVDQSGGAYVRVEVFQDSGANRTIGATAGQLADWFQVTKIL